MGIIFECVLTFFIYAFFSAVFAYIHREGKETIHGIYKCLFSLTVFICWAFYSFIAIGVLMEVIGA